MTEPDHDDPSAEIARVDGRVERHERLLAAHAGLTETARNLSRLAIAAAAFAVCAATWVASSARSNELAIRELTQQNTELREELKRIAADRKRAWRLASATLNSSAPLTSVPSPADSGGTLPPFGEAADVDELRLQLRQTRTRVEEVAGGLIDWGEETKRYVDQRLTAAASEHRAERVQELEVVLARLRALEGR